MSIIHEKENIQINFLSWIWLFKMYTGLSNIGAVFQSWECEWKWNKLSGKQQVKMLILESLKVDYWEYCSKNYISFVYYFCLTRNLFNITFLLLYFWF